MATKFFKHATAVECDLAKSEGKVGLCNVSTHKVEVDEEGHFIPPRGHAIIDKTNKVIEGLVARGQVVINETVTEQPKPASRSKKKDEEVVEEAVEAPSEAVEEEEVAVEQEVPSEAQDV